MKRQLLALGVLAALAACSTSGQTDSAATDRPTVTTEPTTESSPTPRTPPASKTPTPSPTPTPAKSSAAPGVNAFCDYLAQTEAAQQTVEGPEQFVALVAGAQAVAPGAIAEDLALFVKSTRKLATTVTGTPAQVRRADAWLERNAQAIDTAEANVNNYALSACGRPFIAGEAG